jgi:hypothetical protein
VLRLVSGEFCVDVGRVVSRFLWGEFHRASCASRYFEGYSQAGLEKCRAMSFSPLQSPSVVMACGEGGKAKIDSGGLRALIGFRRPAMVKCSPCLTV